MADEHKKEVHFTFADNFAPYFLLIFSPIFVCTCLFGIVYTYLSTEVSFLLDLLLLGEKTISLRVLSPSNPEIVVVFGTVRLY